ncbi:MAG: N-acetylmuramoyl-L-alanine amidase [Lachnoclostridium sp.]|nr:N-acetylmuramoyl-L-alanine amidase [Lachnoclostridium sp.]
MTKNAIYIKYALCFLLFWGTLFTFGLTVRADARVQETEDPIVIVIDPGHGGKNLGTTQNGFEEKSITLVTAKAMYEELKKYDNVEVYLTRTEDVGMDLDKRAQFAKSVNADFLFSIHYNASETHESFGSEVWVSCKQPYHSYGYQFGYVQMLAMQEKGLFLRGIKTRVGEKNLDYYGIIRESVALDIPAVIIEHCHVDESRDTPFCDTKEKQEEFGRADALSVAKYFGLKSTLLGVDYSDYSNKELPTVPSKGRIEQTIMDSSPPDVCEITLISADPEAGEAVFEVSAADYGGMLLYYDYSIDGGKSYCPREPWPGSNIFDDTYTDTFSLTLQFPSGTKPKVIFRAYNKTDMLKQSNAVTVSETVIPPKTLEEPPEATSEEPSETSQPITSEESPEPTETLKNDQSTAASQSVPAFAPENAQNTQNETTETQVGLFGFLKICLVIVIILFAIVLFSQILADYMHKQRVRRRKMENSGSAPVKKLSKDVRYDDFDYDYDGDYDR